MSVVTLDEVKEHLRILDDADNALLARLIDVAEEFVEGFAGPLSGTADEVPAGLKQAILLAVEAEFSASDDARSRAMAALLPYRQWAF